MRMISTCEPRVQGLGVLNRPPDLVAVGVRKLGTG